jgi:hypothetical protein
MKPLAVFATAVVLAGLLFFGRASQEKPLARAATGEEAASTWLKVVFGVDQKDAAWDGSLSVSGGRVDEIESWSFEERDQLKKEERSWTARTAILEGRRATYAEPTRGLLIKVDASPKTIVKLETKQGTIEFSPRDIQLGWPAKFLDGRATVEVLGFGDLVAETETDDDFPAIAIDERGHRHVLWQAYDDVAKRDWLLIRNVDAGSSENDGAKPVPVFDAKEFADPHLYFLKRAGKEQLVAVFASPGENQNWDIYAAWRTSQGWSPQRLCSAEGSDIHLAADAGPDGSLWVAWQSLRNGNGDIFARRYYNGEWSDELAVTSTAADEWEPSISVAQNGMAWIGYDSYASGNYDVHVVPVYFLAGPTGKGLKAQKPIAVATSPDFEAHASVLADDDSGGVWVAYDAAGANWGKDFRNGPTMTEGGYSEPLHASRRVELRLVEDGKVHWLKQTLPQVRPPERIHTISRLPSAKPSRFYEYPQLARDGEGRVWLMFRLCRQGYCAHPPMGIDWRICATTLTEDGWLEPVELPRSQGRQNQRVAFDTDPNGQLHFAWAEGNRFASVNRKYTVQYGTLPKLDEAPGSLDVEEVELDEPTTPTGEPDPQLTMEKGGKVYNVYFGDLHRHTNISRCMPTIDGSLDDAHRYALNAVEYDFLAVTDHTRDVDPFSWWRTQKACDWYDIPGRYSPIYAYERSNKAPGGGHRNVFFLKRGAEVNPSDHWADGVGREKTDTDPNTTLYPWMKERGDALTAAHTPEWSKAESKGTWTYHDPQVEPVAEIFQGFRKSYERPKGSVVEQASLWHALNKGHRLGFIASSDHMSTHMSFACVWATGKTREEIFEALSSRRTYAATDRIGLAFQIGEALMGEDVKLAPKQDVRIDLEIHGTGPIANIEIVRSGKVIATIPKPVQKNVDGWHRALLQFVDSNTPDGRSYYYARVVQQDGAIAWGSPIWVNR